MNLNIPSLSQMNEDSWGIFPQFFYFVHEIQLLKQLSIGSNEKEKGIEGDDGFCTFTSAT